MKRIITCLLICLFLGNTCFAFNLDRINPWYIDGAFGMARYSVPTYSTEHTTAMGRLSLGNVLLTQSLFQLSIEGGIQSGNSLKLNFADDNQEPFGGVPIAAKFNPLLDVLVGLNSDNLAYSPAFLWFKGGIAYRELQVDRESINNLKAFSPEIQIGISYQFNELGSVKLGYQYIWGKQPQLVINATDETGILRNMPAQQALILGFSFNFL